MLTPTLNSIFPFLLAISLMHGQVEPGIGVKPSAQDSAQAADQLNRLFDAIESAIVAADVKKLSPYFAKQMNLNLPSGMSGYFSSNQSYYILQNYLSSRKILSFKFTSRKLDDTAPFATGGGSARARGTNEILQIYVALVEVDSRWVISQFNVY